MNKFSELESKGGKAQLPPICASCPWLEWHEGEQGCVNYKTLLCRLAPAYIIEKYFEFKIFGK